MELAKAYVQIVPSSKGINGSIEKILDPEAQSAGKSAGDSIGSNIVGGLKKALVGAGVTKVVKDALDAGGALQQSFGGLETIYGGASKFAKDYAADAAKAGISMNDYAEQAVSFGASLKQAYGGDTMKAVKAANTAILDMADNSAKMGTDLSAIQNAYQGFAKQNYTMLDNLKLGYGGTKSEMERLLADAQKLTGVEYNIQNLGDVYDAIHAIQQDLGLTGVAAAEAEGTFTGSMQAMKAYAENFMAALTTGGDIKGALNNLIGSTVTFFSQNLVPMLGNLISALPDAIVQLVKSLVAQSPQLLEAGQTILTSLWEGVKSLAGTLFGGDGGGVITEFINSVTSGFPSVIEKGGEVIANIYKGIVENLPKMYEGATNLILSLVDGIANNLPNIVASITNVVSTILKTFLENLPKIIEMGVTMLGKLVAGIIKAIPQVLKAIASLIKTVVDNFKGYDWKSLGKNIIDGIVNGLKAAGSAIWEALKTACQEAWDGVKSFFKIGSPSRLMADTVGKWIPAGIAVGVEGNTKPLTDAMDDLSTDAVSNATSVISSMRTNKANTTNAIADNNSEIIDLMTTYLPIIAEKCGVEISADSKGIFKAVVKENAINTRTTGVNALAY